MNGLFRQMINVLPVDFYLAALDEAGEIFSVVQGARGRSVPERVLLRLEDVQARLLSVAAISQGVGMNQRPELRGDGPAQAVEVKKVLQPRQTREVGKDARGHEAEDPPRHKTLAPRLEWTQKGVSRENPDRSSPRLADDPLDFMAR